jgi:DNA-binding transcriptional MerR regulator/Tfp pilus assembly protein PilF
VQTYSLSDVARILKVSPARLRYWERTDLVQAPAKVESRAEFEFRDLVCLRGIVSLLEQGVPLRRIRRNVEALRKRLPEIDDPLRSLRLWVEGSDRVVVRHDGILLEPDGQAVLDFGSESAGEDGVTSIGRAMTLSASDAAAAAEECFAQGCGLDSDSATFDQAIECYLEGLRLQPGFADCHCNLGAVYYNQGKRVAARRCFVRCLEIDSQHVEANINLANLLEEDGEDDQALRHYRAAFAADPLYPDLHINMALLYEKLGRSTQAERHWRRYLQLDASGPWADVARRRLSQVETIEPEA